MNHIDRFKKGMCISLIIVFLATIILSLIIAICELVLGWQICMKYSWIIFLISTISIVIDSVILGAILLKSCDKYYDYSKEDDEFEKYTQETLKKLEGNKEFCDEIPQVYTIESKNNKFYICNIKEMKYSKQKKAIISDQII